MRDAFLIDLYHPFLGQKLRYCPSNKFNLYPIMIHRYVALFLGLVFILFAYFQVDDADATRWVAVYLIAAVLSFGFFMGKVSKSIFLIAAVAALVGAFYFFPYGQWHGIVEFDKYREVEFARESLGLGICALAMLYYFMMRRRAV